MRFGVTEYLIIGTTALLALLPRVLVGCALIGLLVAIVGGTPVGSTIVAVDILAFALCSLVGTINK